MGRASNGVVEVTGEVVSADVIKRRFRLRLARGRTLLLPFTRGQERAVLRALSEREDQRLKVKGPGVKDKSGAVRSVEKVSSLSLVPVSEEPSDGRLDIWDKLDALRAEVPQAAWKNLPQDGAINHDHYIYGAPRVEE